MGMGALLGEGEASRPDQCAGRNGDDGKVLQGAMASRARPGPGERLVRVDTRSSRSEAQAALLHHSRQQRAAVLRSLAEVYEVLERDEQE